MEPRRIGFIAAPLAIPIVLATLHVARQRDHEGTAPIVVPVVIGVAVLAASMFAGFFPDSLGCPGLERYGPLPPDCTTPSSVQRWALTEAVVVWAFFGFVACSVKSGPGCGKAAPRRSESVV